MSKKRKYSALMTLGVTYFAFLVQLGTVNSEPINDGGLPKVEVNIPGTAAEVKGIALAGTGAPGLVASGNILVPNRITLHLQDGTSLSMTARSSSVIVLKGVIESVIVSPLMEPMPFAQLKAQILKTLKNFQIDEGEIKSQLDQWSDNNPPPAEGGISPPMIANSLKVFHGLGVGIEINGNPKGWFYQIAFTAMNPGLVTEMTPSSPPLGARIEEIRPLSLKLPEPAADAKGFEPQAIDNGMNEVDLVQPRQLDLGLPDGQTISLAARSLSIIYFDGVAKALFIRRPMQVVSFRAARDDLIATLTSLHLEPDDVMKSLMSDWPDDAPSLRQQKKVPGCFGAGFRNPIHGLEVKVRLCPDESGGWYYYLIFDTPYADTPPSTMPARSARSDTN